jgi:Glycosyltransferase WbsX
MKTIAMFLPQFHACPYNSSWWGAGFTEWDNVRSALPLFPGHLQPRSPKDGYYNLAEPGEISRQAKVARAHGIDGFAIYHYWYEGKRLLAKPLDLILANPEIDINFSLCWANHSWTRSWKNRSGAFDVLIEQTYERDLAEREKHFAFLCQAFIDLRYIKVGNRPLLQIYMPESIPDAATYLGELRHFVHARTGLYLHLSAMVTAWRPDWKYLQEFDSATLFQPSLALFSPERVFATSNNQSLGTMLESRIRVSPHWFRRILYRLQDWLPERPKIFSYEDTWDHLLNQYRHAVADSPIKVFPMAFVDFDNTPRYRRRAKLFSGFTVDGFSRYLHELSQEADHVASDSLLFINAWNEWGEGMYLQPDSESGDARLRAVSAGVSVNNWSMK